MIMKYIIADIDKVTNIGIIAKGHLIQDRLIIINEKELMSVSCIEGELEVRAGEVSGHIYTNTEINQLIGKGGWKHGL